MILSFHPLYRADRNLLCAGRNPGPAELAEIQRAEAVILPQGCRESLYRMAKNNCPHVFPDYRSRFDYPGKIGQARLFRKTGVPHPRTVCFQKGTLTPPGADDMLSGLPFDLPFVFKFDWGGESETVFPLYSPEEVEKALEKAVLYEKSGQVGFLIQEMILCDGRSLRVVVIHQTCTSYWRVQEKRHGFYTNLAKGAKIDPDSDPALQKAAMTATRRFCRQTGINLAGFDFLFSGPDLKAGVINPLFLEINYFFGRRGLGGSETYYQILQNEIDNWLNTITRTMS